MHWKNIKLHEATLLSGELVFYSMGDIHIIPLPHWGGGRLMLCEVREFQSVALKSNQIYLKKCLIILNLRKPNGDQEFWVSEFETYRF